MTSQPRSKPGACGDRAQRQRWCSRCRPWWCSSPAPPTGPGSAPARAELAASPRGIRRSFRQYCQKLPEDLRDREHDVLRFTTDLRVAPTSNQAESDLRPAKTQEKISGRLRSEDTTRHRYAIRGHISNRRQAPGLRPHAMRDAFLGHPWMPPVPDRT
jgi:hypothetical protein